MDEKLRITHVLIHGFAAAHAATAATLSQTIVGDEAALTVLTISMIIAIARLHGQTVEVGSAFALLGTFAGFYLGTRGAVFFVKWIPFLGNAANAIATTVTTETLGWVTYYIVSQGKSIESVRKDEVEDWIKESKKYKKEHEKEWKEMEKTIKEMTSDDKEMYESLVKELRKEGLRAEEQKQIEKELTALFEKYENK